MTRVFPSTGVSSPSLTALRTQLVALDASMEFFISGSGKDTDLSLGARAMRSIQRRRANPSPSNALEIAVCVRASAWPSIKLSMASVFLFLAPLSLPELPEVNLPAVFLPFFIALFILYFKTY